MEWGHEGEMPVGNSRGCTLRMRCIPAAMAARTLTARHCVCIHAVQLIIQRQDLQRAQRVQQVRVVPLAAAKAAALSLAGQHPGHHCLAVQQVQPPQQVQRREPPVHPAHPKVLGGVELEALLVLQEEGGR